MIGRSEAAPVEGISGGDGKEVRQKLRIQPVLSCGRSSSASLCVVVTTALGTSPFLPLQERKPAQGSNS